MLLSYFLYEYFSFAIQQFLSYELKPALIFYFWGWVFFGGGRGDHNVLAAYTQS